MIKLRHTYTVIPAQHHSIVGRILESNILDDSVGYRYPTYDLLSKEAQAVCNEGLKLWQASYRADIERKVRDKYPLDKSGAGWCKIRNALKKAVPQTSFAPFGTTHATLAAKLEPLVYEYSFLKE